MSLSCYDSMMIEEENPEIGQSFKRMKLTSQANYNNNQIVINNVQDPLKRLKTVFPYMQEEVNIFYLSP